MALIRTVELEEGTAIGIEVDIPNEDQVPMVLLVGRKGYLMCGYLNLEVAESSDDRAALVTGVSCVDDMRARPVQAATRAASEAGVRVGMKGEDALRLLM